MTIKTNETLVVRSNVKAGALNGNYNESFRRSS